MPVLINNIQDKDLESRYNKAKNIIANGYKLMMAKEDVDSPSSLAFKSSCHDENCVSKYHTLFFKILQDSATGLSLDNLPDEYSMQNSDEKSYFKWTDNDVQYVFTTSDGFIYGVLFEYTSPLSIVVDVNNNKRPNTVKRDLFKFKFDDKGVLTDASNELEQKGCTGANPSECKTEEACIRANYGGISGPGCYDGVEWVDGHCVYIPGKCG